MSLSYSREIPRPLSDVDGAITQGLRRTLLDGYSFEGEQDSTGSVLFKLRFQGVGEVGVISLLQNGSHCQVTYQNPPLPPYLPLTTELQGIQDVQQIAKRLQQLQKRGRQERNEHRQQTRELFQFAVKQLALWIQQQGLLTVAQPELPESKEKQQRAKLEERKRWEFITGKVREYEEWIRKGLQKAAAHLVKNPAGKSIPRETLNTWRKRVHASKNSES